jgi:hypothetical protein
LTAQNIGMPLSSSQGLYWDPEANDGAGARITTHSMIKTFRRCAKQAEYKYVHRLKPKRLGSPLKRGVWVHALLEAYHSGEDWKEVHAKYSAQFAKLFDEEKDYYGDLPRIIKHMMTSYIWHYQKDPWTWIDSEFQLEAELPDGTIYRGKVDSMIENQFGLWLVDHKTHARLPGLSYKLLDAQSALYLWAARQNGIPVKGFIWNYIKWKEPTVPALVDRNRRLTKSNVDSDYPTYVRAIKQYQRDHPDTFVLTDENRAKARYLRSQQFEWGKPQTSEFFRRDVLEKDDDFIARVLEGSITTSNRLHTYPFENPNAVERMVERSCEFACSYTDLCQAELMGANVRPLLRNYQVGDPNDYYNDRAGDFDKEEK